MTPEELVAQLAPIRVPEAFARFGFQDALCALSLGLVAGLVIARFLQSFGHRVPDPSASLKTEVSALRNESREGRLSGLAAILHRADVPLPEGLPEALYDPHAPFDPLIAEKAVLASQRKRRP